MCGICGFITKKEIKLEELKKMNDTMYHRGPNDSGEEIYAMKEGYSLGFGQRRLSILDLSPLGHQPMHSDNGRLSIVFNGEIYNFLELREELKAYPFKSHCDTEVILAAYLTWGVDCVNRFNGMFAIAIYDREEETVFLMRDRVGKKPLYYWSEGNEFVFASELKPIMEYPGFSKELDTSVVQSYLYQQYINAPDSIFKNVHKVEPGMILCFKQGVITKRKFWDVATRYHEKKMDPPRSYEEAKEELKDLLVGSVKKRMIADVPLGSFLSGGYDSSLITAMAQSISNEPVKTYSIGFHEDAYNEAKYASAVAKHLGTNHTEMYIGEEDMFRMVASIPKYFDEPFADSSEIPTMLVSEVAAKDVTVALSGDGGDEFFCGYNVYESVGLAQKLDLLGGMVYGVSQIPGFKQAGLLDRLPYSIKTIAKNRDKQTKTQFGGENYIKIADEMVLGQFEKEKRGKFHSELSYEEKNWQERRMLLDMDTYLPGDILCKVDRASMKYSLESRCPILDVDVMEYAFSLPHEYKYHKGNKKRILKDIAYDYIPKELLERPKVGFGVPLDKWMRGPLREQLMEMSQVDFLKKQNVFQSEYVNQFVESYLRSGDKGPGTGQNYSKILWSYFVFQQWYQEYMK